MLERIQKIISARGLASRRYAEQLILDGRVTCNGIVCELGHKADPDADIIAIDGKPLPEKSESVYILLNKPRGYVTTLSDEKGRKNVTQLVSDCGRRVYPVGRLDMDSEGLLLLTDDGNFANRLMHPKNVVDKTYNVWVNDFMPEKLKKLQQPVELDGYRIQPPVVKLLEHKQSKAKLRITIHEGRNRQIRRMCDLAAMGVERLQRVQEGSLLLGDLPLGKWRYLTQHEVADLLAE